MPPRRFSGTRARALRQAAGLRPEHVALAIGRSVDTLTKYEQSRVTPSVATLAKMADLYGQPADEFLTEPHDGDLAAATIRTSRIRVETLLAGYETAIARYRTDRDAWYTERRRQAAEALGWPIEEVTPLAIGFSAAWSGVPDPDDHGPTLATYLTTATPTEAAG